MASPSGRWIGSSHLPGRPISVYLWCHMRPMDGQVLLDALRATGSALGSAGPGIRLCVCGGGAGLLAGLLKATRTTGDRDVMWQGAKEDWRELVAAATAAAQELGLPANWLNRDSSTFAWCLPLGWVDRCESVGRFGRLGVVRLSRWDLIAAKVISAPRRPQDFQDLRDLQPTADELDRVIEHLDRLMAEHAGGEAFDDQRTIVETLRSAP